MIWENGQTAGSHHNYKKLNSSYRKITYFDEFGFAGLIERARFGFLLDLAAKYSINRLIDSRNCFELIQRNYVIPSRDNNHEYIRTVEQIVSGDKGCMIISPQIGLHEDVLVLDYDNEYANLIVNHNLSYETVGGGEARKRITSSRSRAILFIKRIIRTTIKPLHLIHFMCNICTKGPRTYRNRCYMPLIPKPNGGMCR